MVRFDENTKVIMDKIFLKFKFLRNQSLFLILGGLTVLPLLLLSFFNNPGSDDFDYSYESQTEPFLALQLRRYLEWSGRYFSNGLLSFDPLTYHNYWMFKVVPIMLIVLFIFALYFFISSLKITNSKKGKWTFVGVITFLYIAQMPDICEGFYWMPGSITNQLPVSLSLLFFGLLLKYYQNKKASYLMLSIIFLAAILGCNEISVVTFLMIIAFLFLYNVFYLRKLSGILLLLLIVTIIFSAIELIAPGNSVRAANITVKHEFVFSVLKSLQLSVGFIFEWLPLLSLCVFFFLGNIQKWLDYNPNSPYLIHPLLAFGLLFSIVFCGIFPGLWSLNGPPPNRAINTVYFFFLFAALYFTVTVLHYFRTQVMQVFANTSGLRIWLGILIILNFLSNESVLTAYRDLLSGKAYQYDAEMNDRFKIIDACREKTCIVPPLAHKPKTIYNEVDFSLTTDKNNWKNLEVSRYFKKEIIISKPKDTLFAE